MTGVDYRRERWLGADEALPSELDTTTSEAEVARPDPGLCILAGACALLAVAWVGASAWALATEPSAGPRELIARLAAACPPLVLIGLVYLIAARNSRRESDRLGRASAKLRAEQARLDAALVHTTQCIAHERLSVGEHADQLAMIGDDAAHRLRVIGDGLRRDIEGLARDASGIATASAQARSDLAVLTDELPRARGEIDALIASIDTAGLRSHERAGALDAAVVALAGRAREVDDVAGGAAQRLAAHLARVEGTSAAATSAIVTATDTMTGAIDRTLAHASDAAGAVRHVVDGQSDAMLAIVKQGEAALAKTGAETGERLRERVAAVSDEMTTLGIALADQREAGARIVADLSAGLGRVDEQLAGVAERATSRGADIGATLAQLGDQAAMLGGAFEASETTADALVAQVETLITVLDAATREVEETLPAAFARLDETTHASVVRIEGARPHVEHFAQEASDALDRLTQADDQLRRQQAALAALGDVGGEALAVAHDQARALLAIIEEAKRATGETSEAANVDLVEALANVRAAARHAVEDTRAALEAVAPDAAERLGRSVRAALRQQVDDDVAGRVAELGQTAERAVAAANLASDRLMRQMLTIAQTSAQVEARIAEVRTEAEDADRDDFSRRVALLIESLNSTAIDVAKVLSNDVSDAAWAAYLKGDRGVFARRAVRLLDAAELREITRHYGDDAEFREQVNRYIHDFESMLRNVLATRNGSPLGVTLLSSDMGKLYVALAQAIERLRA